MNTQDWSPLGRIFLIMGCTLKIWSDILKHYGKSTNEQLYVSEILTYYLL